VTICLERERDDVIARIRHELNTTGIIPLDLVLKAHELGIIVTEVKEKHNG
jgi:hypothetical protein